MVGKLEKVIEQAVSKYAKDLGMIVSKLNPVSMVGLPDRIYLYNNNVFFIEFKSKGKTPSHVQWSVHKLLLNHGFKTYIVDNIQDGKRIIDSNLT